MPRDKFEGCWRGTPLCQVTQCGRKHSREAKGWVVNTDSMGGRTDCNNKHKASKWPSKPGERPSYPQREVCHPLLERKTTTETLHQQQLSFSSTQLGQHIAKNRENDRLTPPPQGRNLAMYPLCHISTKNHWDYQSQTLHQGGELLRLSTPGHLHAVSAKCFSPEKCGSAPELLAQSPPRKGCCKRV